MSYGTAPFALLNNPTHSSPPSPPSHNTAQPQHTSRVVRHTPHAMFWFDVCSRLISRPDATAPAAFTDARSDAPLRFGPYVGGWRSLGTTLVRGGEVQADVGLRLGMSW